MEGCGGEGGTLQGLYGCIDKGICLSLDRK